MYNNIYAVIAGRIDEARSLDIRNDALLYYQLYPYTALGGVRIVSAITETPDFFMAV